MKKYLTKKTLSKPNFQHFNKWLQLIFENDKLRYFSCGFDRNIFKFSSIIANRKDQKMNKSLELGVNFPVSYVAADGLVGYA